MGRVVFGTDAESRRSNSCGGISQGRIVSGQACAQTRQSAAGGNKPTLHREGVVCSIIIPAYNESSRISQTLDKLLLHAISERGTTEIVVVDDGSTDNTVEIVGRYAAQHSSVRLVCNPEHRGKGYSVRNGVSHACSDLLLLCDADLSVPISEAFLLSSAILSGADVAIGSRWLNPALQLRPQPAHRRWMGRCLNVLSRLLLGLRFKDTQCGFKMFTREAADAIFRYQRIDGWGFDVELLLLAGKLGFGVQEIPVAVVHDDRSRICMWRDGPALLVEILRIVWYARSSAYAKDEYGFGRPSGPRQPKIQPLGLLAKETKNHVGRSSGRP